VAGKRELMRLGMELLHGAQNGRSVGELEQQARERIDAIRPTAAPATVEYVEPVGTFLDATEPPVEWIFPEFLPRGVVMLVHGDPRARKTLVAFELARAAATGTAPFGLRRLQPRAPMRVLYVQEEDPRALTRQRLQTLLGGEQPDTLYVSVRRGINLDIPEWTRRLIADLTRLEASVLILDAARRLSAKTDEGPGRVRELTAVLRAIVNETGASLIIVHHDVKPPQNSQDLRRRSQRASGADWFAASECPVHVERLSDRESLVFPQDYKFAADPAPFTVRCEVAGGLITRLVGAEITTEQAERAGLTGRVLDWLRANGPATKSAMKKAGLGRWETIETALELLTKDGKVDAAPGRKVGSLRYFVSGESSPAFGDASATSGDDLPF
jgi:hypothetical protein